MKFDEWIDPLKDERELEDTFKRFEERRMRDRARRESERDIYKSIERKKEYQRQACALEDEARRQRDRNHIYSRGLSYEAAILRKRAEEED